MNIHEERVNHYKLISALSVLPTDKHVLKTILLYEPWHVISNNVAF